MIVIILSEAVTNATTCWSQSGVTTIGYDSQGRATAQTDALGNTVHTAYDSLGNVVSASGATYPVSYTYDTAGRMTALATTRDGAAWDTTQWLTDRVTGLASNKVYADGSRIDYTYTSDGKLLSTIWARGAWRENATDALGCLNGVSYSDATAAVALAYDAFQRLAVASNAVAAYAYANDNLGAITNETVAIGTNTHTLVRAYDGFHRLASLTTAGGAVHYNYDVEGRFATASNDVFAAAYSYTSNGWADEYTVSLTNGVVLARALTRDTYRRSLVRTITNSVNGVPMSPLVYAYDPLGRVTGRNADVFGYNARSEVTEA